MVPLTEAGNKDDVAIRSVGAYGVGWSTVQGPPSLFAGASTPQVSGMLHRSLAHAFLIYSWQSMDWMEAVDQGSTPLSRPLLSRSK